MELIVSNPFPFFKVIMKPWITSLVTLSTFTMEQTKVEWNTITLKAKKLKVLCKVPNELLYSKSTI
jgi:hypothetical protein